MMITTKLRPCRIVVFLLCALVSLTIACKSKEKKGQAGLSSGSTTSGKPAAAKPQVSQSLDVWDEPQPFPPSGPQIDPANADALIDRYDKECFNAANSANCETLRLQVESVFLADLVDLRAEDQDIDREWYRVAANAGTPQLACIGLRELIYSKDRTPEEEDLILASIDSPFRENRNMALNAQLPKIKELWPRSRFNRQFGWGLCMSDLRDPDPGVKWAGNYPGARFRHFASNNDLKWFTTPDSVEKVLAYFKNQGKKPMTIEEMNAAEQAKFVEEVTKISSSPQPGGEKKIMELLMKTGTSSTWDVPFRGMEGAGEIRYVMLTPKQAIAIFKDDILHATSIVAPRPQPVDRRVDIDIEKEKAKLQDEELARKIYKY